MKEIKYCPYCGAQLIEEQNQCGQCGREKPQHPDVAPIPLSQDRSKQIWLGVCIAMVLFVVIVFVRISMNTFSADVELDKLAATVNQTAQDRKLLDLKGNVKSFKVSGYFEGPTAFSNEAVFDEKGSFILDEEFGSYTRNEDGQIIELICNDFDDQGDESWRSEAYIYDENGLLQKVKHYTDEMCWESTFERNSNGDIVVCKDYVPESHEETVTHINYRTYDEEGNWTSLEYNGIEVTRKLTYWK